jgi:hypothetical protein
MVNEETILASHLDQSNHIHISDWKIYITYKELRDARPEGNFTCSSFLFLFILINDSESPKLSTTALQIDKSRTHVHTKFLLKLIS